MKHRTATNTNTEKRIYADILFKYPSVEIHVSYTILMNNATVYIITFFLIELLLT